MRTWLKHWGSVFRDRWTLLALLRHAPRRQVIALAAAGVVSVASPTVMALSVGWVVRDVGRVVSGDHGRGALVLPVVVLISALLATRVAESARSIAAIRVTRSVDGWARDRSREVALAPRGIEHLEDPKVQDDLLRAGDLGAQRGRQRSPGTASIGQTQFLFRLGVAAASAVVVARFSVWLGALVMVGSLAARAAVRRQWMHLADVDDAGTRPLRRAEYWSDVATGAAAGKEVRLFGLGDWVADRRRQLALAWFGPVSAARLAVMRKQWGTGALAFGSALAALLAPGVAAAKGSITPAELATYLAAAWVVFRISSMGNEAFDIEYGLGAVRALQRLEAMDTPSGRARPLPDGRVPEVRFDEVAFRYPGAGSMILDGFSLRMAPGEVLAVVGPNGAGKTTFAKLLAGLYLPIAGRISVDGVDVAELAVDEWRARVSAVFQDFLRYPTSLAANVALSAPEHLADVAGVKRALARAGAESMVAALPDGIDTLLWRGGTGGVDLSGGQWQKLAIARALFAVEHGRQILILDEPTAHLDVRAEADFFESVIGAANGASVVLVSHRLSTVRHADRIVLLDNGRIAESGRHDELIAAGGRYARLFALQAARFVDRGALS